MPMILVADDSEVDRMLISEILKKEPLDWLIEVVPSAEEAVKLMREMAFDVVVTDVLMSGMSGLELLNHVHRQPHRVPVIVISGQEDSASAVEALQQGAASYVPKSELASRLGESVRQVLEVARTEQSYQNLIGSTDEMRFQFSLGNDISLIKPLVNLLQQMAAGMQMLSAEARTRLGIAVDEAVINAICHGNLELSEREMKEVRKSLHADIPIEAIESRRVQPEYRDRNVKVSAGLSHEGMKIIIRDDGKGFPVKEIGAGQRGLTLIRNLVDKVSFNEPGNELTLTKFRDIKHTEKAA